MRLAKEPVVLSGYYEYYSNAVIISETNGVGGNITTAELAWMYQGATGEIYNYPGKRFQAFESWQVEDTFYIQYRYDKVRVTLKGRDDNGFDFNFQKEWDIYYQ